MKTDYKINFLQQTADNYTTFAQTEQSNAIIAKNLNSISNGAKKAGNDIASKAQAATKANFIGSKVNTTA